MPILKKPRRAIVWDTETTGLTLHPAADVSKQPRMIEFGAAIVDMSDGSIIYNINHLINPGVKLEPIITKITGITDEDLKDAPAFRDVWRELRPHFESASVMIAHNLPFDKSILAYELEREGVKDFPWPVVEICTVGLYKHEWGRDPKLKELYEAHLGKPLEQTHRASDDADALVEILQHDKIWGML